ncbi:phage tail tape measure protein [Streptomyces sp. NPDC055794]
MTLEELLVSVGINTDDLTAGADGAADQVESSLGGIQTAAAGAAVGGLFMAGMQSAMDLQAVETQLQNSLGLTEEEAARAGDAAGRVFSAGFGASVEEVGEAIDGVASSMGGLSSMTNEELDEMTKHAMVLSKTLGVDVAEASEAAGALIRNGMAKDGQEAFDILTQAAATLPKAMRADIPAVVGEYGKHFQRLGIDGQTAFGMLSQYVQAGGRDIDQAADVIHEFARITSEETDRASAAFKTLGLDSGQMLADIGKGGPAAEQALGKTLAALRGVEDPAKQAALGVELFGDMAGEGADALWAMDPASAAAASGMDQAAGAAGRATEAAAASQSLSAIWRTMATTLGEMLLPVLRPLAQFMAENPALVKILAVALILMAAAIGIAVIAQWAWNTALWAFPGTWIIAAIIALIAIVVLIVVYWDEIVAATKAAWQWLRSLVASGIAWITVKMAGGLDWLEDRWNQGWNWVTGKTRSAVNAVLGVVGWLSAMPGRVAGYFNRIVSYVSGLPGRISRAASGMWNGLLSGFRGVLNRIIGGWNGLSFTVGGGSFMGVDIPSITLSTPNIPYLAEGGVTTGPTFAMIGEGREQEAVLPLSKLDGMLRSVAGAVRQTGGSQDVNLRVEVAGPREFRGLIREVVAAGSRGGDVQSFFGPE